MKVHLRGLLTALHVANVLVGKVAYDAAYALRLSTARRNIGKKRFCLSSSQTCLNRHFAIYLLIIVVAARS